MRNHPSLRLAGAAAVFSLTAGLMFASPATAFGLSDRQRDHIDTYFKCKLLLLTDLAGFEADPDCGGTPAVNLSSTTTKSGSPKQPRCEYVYAFAIQGEYEHCPK